MRRAALCCPPSMVDYVYAMGRRGRLSSIVDLAEGSFDDSNFDARLAELADVEVVFSTWGMPKVFHQRLDAMPKLKAVFYAAGTVKTFAKPLLERDITLVSAWRANAIPVAEFTLAQILLSAKSYFANCDIYRTTKSFNDAPRGDGIFGQTVALLGVGAIGRKVIELLKPFSLSVIVFDPFLSDSEAKAMGVRKVSLDEAFREAAVVSNHLANLPTTVGMIRGSHFSLMRQNSTFINTGRGAQVNEAEMIATLRARPDIYALLDVTWPEPPVPNSALWTLPNVRVSSHIAGSIGNEVVRMADLVMEEFQRWEAGQPLQHHVTLEMLDRMA